jgi:hypothetical protein
MTDPTPLPPRPEDPGVLAPSAAQPLTSAPDILTQYHLGEMIVLGSVLIELAKLSPDHAAAVRQGLSEADRRVDLYCADVGDTLLRDIMRRRTDEMRRVLDRERIHLP